MKALMTFALLSFATLTFAQAELPVLVCSTVGDALDSVELVKSSNGDLIKINKMDETTESFKVRTNLKNIIKGDSDTLIGTSEKSLEFGGAITDSILIRVAPGQKTAFMAFNGVVFSLKCMK